MRIVVLLTDLFDAVGGIQTFNRTLVKALDEMAGERDWTVTVLVLNDRGGNAVPGRYFNAARTTYRPFARHKSGFVAAALRETFGASIVILGHVHFSPLAYAMSWLAGRSKKYLVVYGVDVWKRLPFYRRMGLRSIDHVLSISAYTTDRMLQHNGPQQARFHLFPCTLDPFYAEAEKIVARGDLRLPAGRMILSVSRLDASDRYKGIDKVIEALPRVLEKVPGAFYVVVGDGTDRKRLERIAEESGVRQNVFFTGRAADGLVPSYYRACDVFALPSLGEGFGIVFLEAMYYAKSCVGARAGGIPEVIEEGKTGFLVEPGDGRTLADVLIRLLSDDDLRRAMGEAGKDRLRREFSFDRFRERLEEIICV